VMCQFVPWVAGTHAGAFWSALPFLVTYTENLHAFSPDYINSGLYSHTWSLAVEEQFYLLWPLVIWVVPTRWLIAVCVSLVVAVLMFRTAILLAEVNDHLRFVAFPRFTFIHIDAFAIGAIARLAPIPAIFRRPASLLGTLVVLAGAGVFLLLINRGTEFQTSFLTLGYLPALPGGGGFAWGYTILNLAFAHLIVVLAEPKAGGDGWLQRFFGLPVLVRLGSISYGFYIYHDVLLTLLRPHFPTDGPGFWVFVLVALVLTIAAAMISFRLIEQPFLGLKDHPKSLGAAAAVERGAAAPSQAVADNR
jgi:peptidoglycan/LPS O-acetylase OafA/YrhL